ncbi:MAG: hypothetical protein LPK07_16035 [Hymenobacteraceae bacterium]|nr:hypothetical protein [Hymenobacteraceae bacterium]
MEQTAGRVGQSSSDKANQEVTREIIQNITRYKGAGDGQISKRIEELDKEWDVEKILEVNASTLALTGVLLGAFVNRRWLILPSVVTSFLLQHGLQGWCPPLPLFRKMGIRSRREIDEEKFALKLIRGDFEGLSEKSDTEAILEAFRKR